MRLVVEFIYGDGCTYSGTVTRPVEYSSPEAFLVEFEEACRKVLNSYNIRDFEFAGHIWEPGIFFHKEDFYPPDIMTIDEWFGNVIC